MPATAEVSVDVNAPAVRVYEMVSDLPRMGEWSPECVRCRWLGGASVAVPGARFRGYNRRGIFRWSTTGEVVAAEPGKELSFDVTSVGIPVARWRYLLEETGEGTCRVTERWEDHRSGIGGGLMKVLGRIGTGVADREAHNTAGMDATLERIKSEAEAA